MQPSGAPGGDGRYGFKSTYESPVFGRTQPSLFNPQLLSLSSLFLEAQVKVKQDI